MAGVTRTREWLSQAAWCDVRLSCAGGREFQAHKVVLSSVSPFLRVLLQSRPEEDIPTTIVLPDVEPDAMSAVLHYIYNGEVYVPTVHLEAFFSIVKTLQICVDKESLHDYKENIEDFDTKLVDVGAIQNAFTNKLDFISEDKDDSKKERVFEKRLDVENVLKGDRICKTVSKLSPVCMRVAKVALPEQRLQNAESCQSREQRLQHAESCQAVSPERDPPRRYHPASLDRRNGLLTTDTRVLPIRNDDNHKQKSEGETLDFADGSTTSQNRATHYLRSSNCNHRTRTYEENKAKCEVLDNFKNVLPNINFRKDIPIYSNITDLPPSHEMYCDYSPIINKNGMQNFVRKPTVLRPVPTLLPISPLYNPHIDSNYFRPPPDLLDLTSTQFPRISTSRCTTTDSLVSLLPTLNGYVSPKVHNGFINDYKSISMKENSIENQSSNVRRPDRNGARRLAYNQVLAGPWCPRLPPTYRPHPTATSITESLESEPCLPSRTNRLSPASSELDVCKDKLSNDDNNNLRAPTATVPVDQSRLVVTPHSIDAIIGKEAARDPAMRCATCDKVFTCRRALETHVRAHAPPPAPPAPAAARHTCADCGKSFSQLRNYKYHVSVHRGTREFAAACGVCGKYFNDRGYLSSHMKIHRNRKEYECPHCPKSFNQRVAYNMHVRIHTGVKPHACADCGKAFSRKMLLKQHQRTHSGERPYACAVCDKRFADRSNMTLHMRLHSGVKPFSCNLCPKSFTKKHHLKTHLNYHTGDKPYACPRCQLAFSQSSNMRTHLKKCTAPAAPPPLPPPPPPAQ